MKKIIGLMLFLFCVNVFAEQSIVGKWKQFDDDSNELSSIVNVVEENGYFVGYIAEIFKTSKEEKLVTKCQGCSGEFKDKDVVGLRFIWKMKKTAENEYKGGEILDPNDGSTYSCKMKLSQDGKSLDVRGFLGISLFGRSQVWTRIQ